MSFLPSLTLPTSESTGLLCLKSQRSFCLTNAAGPDHQPFFCATDISLLDSCGATLPAASQALRAAHTTRRGALFASPVASLKDSFSPSCIDNARAASAAPVLAIPPPTPTVRAPLRHTGLTALPWPLAPSALAAPPHQCPARFRVLSVPSVHSPVRTCDSARCSQRIACLPHRLARVRRGLTPQALPRCRTGRFVSSLCPHRAHRRRPARVRPGRRRAGRLVRLRKELTTPAGKLVFCYRGAIQRPGDAWMPRPLAPGARRPAVTTSDDGDPSPRDCWSRAGLSRWHGRVPRRSPDAAAAGGATRAGSGLKFEVSVTVPVLRPRS